MKQLVKDFLNHLVICNQKVANCYIREQPYTDIEISRFEKKYDRQLPIAIRSLYTSIRGIDPFIYDVSEARIIPYMSLLTLDYVYENLFHQEQPPADAEAEKLQELGIFDDNKFVILSDQCGNEIFARPETPRLFETDAESGIINEPVYDSIESFLRTSIEFMRIGYYYVDRSGDYEEFTTRLDMTEEALAIAAKYNPNSNVQHTI